MTRTVLLLGAAMVAGLCATPAAPAAAAAGCVPGGSPAPAGAAEGPVADVDGDGLDDTLWIAVVRHQNAASKRFVGVTTASGMTTDVAVVTASPVPLQALMIDAQNDGNHQLIVSYGRGADLYVFADCSIQPAVDTGGQPFGFDLHNLRGNGTGVGCADLGDGRHLVGLQALADDDRWSVRRTEIELDGTVATVGRSDTVTAGSAQDPVVLAAQTISCGELDIDQDGVHQP